MGDLGRIPGRQLHIAALITVLFIYAGLCWLDSKRQKFNKKSRT